MWGRDLRRRCSATSGLVAAYQRPWSLHGDTPVPLSVSLRHRQIRKASRNWSLRNAHPRDGGCPKLSSADGASMVEDTQHVSKCPSSPAPARFREDLPWSSMVGNWGEDPKCAPSSCGPHTAEKVLRALAHASLVKMPAWDQQNSS